MVCFLGVRDPEMVGGGGFMEEEGFMVEEGLFGLADRDEGSVDLADEARVMLGAFLCPRVGLVAAEASR